MLDFALYTGTHTLLVLAAIFLVVLVLAGVGENCRTKPTRSLVVPFAVGLLRFFAFVFLERWFYGALADLAGIAAGIAPLLFFVASTLGQNAQLLRALDAVGAPHVTVGQTITVVALCAGAVVLFRGIAAAIPEPRRR